MAAQRTMKRKVFKYVMGDVTKPLIVKADQDFKILKVGMQRGHVTVWGLVTTFNSDGPDAIRECSYRLWIEPTGMTIDGLPNEYVGTAIDEENGLVWHVFMR